jgi:hypothetical protein
MIRIKHWLPSILLLALASGSAFSQDSNFFPVDDLREGMTGTGLTVFHGTEIEEFDVEILGVLRNSSAKQDLILARLAGGPLAETGVMQGMSGSPVYIDGRLVGAVAYAFDSSQEPIAGIQPIGQMLSVLDVPETDVAANAAAAGPVSAPALPVEGPREYLYRVMTGLRSGQPIGEYLYPANVLGSGSPSRFPAMGGPIGGMVPIRTPLFLSGLSPAAVGEFSGVFEKFGMTAVQGGGVGAAGQLAGTTPVEILPGMSINAEMIRGDITVSANGTVTHVDGDKVYAFGHPFQSTGPADLPMSPGYVMTLVPTRTNSFRIAAPMDVVGAFQQDRSTGIMGRLGVDAQMIPVSVEMQTSRGATELYEYEIIDDRFMTPLMMNLSLFELILATERSLGALTLEVEGTIRLRNGETVEIEAAASGETNAPAEATLSAVAPITYLLSGVYDPLRIVSIDLSIRANDQRRSARLESVRVDRDEVRAGETVEVEALLRTPSGEEFRERYAVPIPAGLAPGRVEVLIGDGVAVTGADFRRAPPAAPRDMAQVLRELRSIRKSDRLYVKVIASTPGAVIGGAEFPSLPPSMLAVLESGRRSDSYTSGTRTSPVLEFELSSSGYVVQGQQSLEVTIVP